MEKTLAAVRLVRTLREPALPDPGYPQRLSQRVAERIKVPGFRRRWILPAVAALAACLCLFVFFDIFTQDVVYAMEKAVTNLNSYHGVMEIRVQNAAGNEWMVRRVELWSHGEKYAIEQDDGTLTVNNGERKWQIRPQSQEVAILPLLPDPTGSSFDLRDEAKQAKDYPHQIVGT